MGRKAILKNLVDIVVMLKAEDDRSAKKRAQLDMMRQKGWIEQEDYDDAIGGLDVREAGGQTERQKQRNLLDSITPTMHEQQPPSQQPSQRTSPAAPSTPSSGGQSDYPKASELPKNAQGQVVGISATDPKWSSPASKPTPSAPPSTPPASPTPTPTAMPKPESTTPPKVLPKYAKETISKAFPGFPQF